MTVEQIRTGGPNPKCSVYTLHRVDPATLEIAYLNKVAEVERIWQEIKRVKSQITPAYAKLRAGRSKPLVTPSKSSP